MTVSGRIEALAANRSLVGSNGARFVAALVVVVAVTLGVLAAINLAVDPSGRFRGTFDMERKSASILLDGKGVVRGWALNDRALNRMIAEDRAAPTGTIVLGSSRSGSLVAGMAGTDDFFNHSMSTALLDDHFGILSIFDLRGRLPKRVIVGIDPWIFSAWPDLDDGAFRIYRPVLGRLASALDVPARLFRHRPADTKWQIFSIAVARTALNLMDGDLPEDCVPKAFDRDVETGCAAIRRDGSHKPTKAQLDKSSEAVAKEIRDSFGRVESKGRMVQGYNVLEMDPERLRAFRRLVDWARGNGSNVVFVLVPFHPLAEKMMTDSPPRPLSDWRRFELLEATLRRMAGEIGVPVFGSYSASRVGCTMGEFVDWMHPRESCMKKATKGLSSAYLESEIR